MQIFYSYPKPCVFLWDLPDSIIALIRDIFDFKVSIIISYINKTLKEGVIFVAVVIRHKLDVVSCGKDVA